MRLMMSWDIAAQTLLRFIFNQLSGAATQLEGSLLMNYTNSQFRVHLMLMESSILFHYNNSFSCS
jgi:hypothetical protein